MLETLEGFDLSQLPIAEDDEFEFKSSRTPPSTLKQKLCNAASGFCNAGGGVFLAGIDDKTGNADGGIQTVINQTPLRDWIDQVLTEVDPRPRYNIALIKNPSGRGEIEPGNCVAAILFHESRLPPHMSSDRRYYLRIGAHTLPARHFIVESLWAKRHFGKPRLAHIVKVDPNTEKTSFLVVVVLATTDAVAIDVQIDLSKKSTEDKLEFPIHASLIDRAHPFAFRCEIPNAGISTVLTLKYADVNNNTYEHSHKIESRKCLSEWHSSPSAVEKISDTLREIKDALRSSRGSTWT